MANLVVPLPSNKPDTEVSARPRRRTYTAAYKLKVLDEVAAATERGAVAAILRREGRNLSTTLGIELLAFSEPNLVS